MPDPEKKSRAEKHLNRHSPAVKITRYLGGGTDGEVWATSQDRAIKVFDASNTYLKERDCYHHLADWGLTRMIEEFQVPAMLSFDDELLTIEMDLMTRPPFIIDFAKTRIGHPPEFSEEAARYHEAECREMFEHNWPAVQRLLNTLESYQIYYLDPKPGNITFPDRF